MRPALDSRPSQHRMPTTEVPKRIEEKVEGIPSRLLRSIVRRNRAGDAVVRTISESWILPT